MYTPPSCCSKVETFYTFVVTTTETTHEVYRLDISSAGCIRAANG